MCQILSVTVLLEYINFKMMNIFNTRHVLACASGFLGLLLCMCVCVCVCVSTPEGIITSGMIWTLCDWFCCFAASLAINIVDGHGLNNETRHRLQPKKTKVTLYYNSKRHFSCCTLLTRQP